MGDEPRPVINEEAVLYDDHQVSYPQHLRRRYWVEQARRGDAVIRDDPDGPPPCKWGHDSCSGGVV